VTFGRAAIAAPTAAGLSPAGAASRKIRPDSLISPVPARTISATTTSVAIASARSNPVSRMTRPATAVAANAYRSVRMCRNAPVRFRLRGAPRAARAMSRVAATLTTTPASATPSTVPPVTAGGSTSLRIAE
jgi:hypothetical protein